MTTRASTCGSLLLVMLLNVSACVGGDDSANSGSSGAGNGGGGAGNGGGGGDELGCSRTTYCGAGGFACGVHAVAACGEVDCGVCRVRNVTVGNGDITAAPDGSVHLAYFDWTESALLHAVPGADGLETDVIADGMREGEAAIAVAHDGTLHVAFVDDSGQVMHATRASSESTWAVALADTSGEGVDVVVDADNAVHILVTGEDPVTRARQVRHVTQNGSTYTATAIGTGMAIGNAVIGRGAGGAIAFAVRSDLMQLAVFDLVAGTFVQDPSLPAFDDQPAEWSVTVSTDGTLRLFALLGNYTLRTGSQLVVATRETDTWNVSPVGGVGAVVTHGIAGASGPQDTQHLAYFARSADGLFYTRPGSTRRLNVRPDCDEGEVKLAVDSADQPHMLYNCDSSDTTYVAPIGRYSDAYFAACEDGANTICDRACECGSPDCCYNDGTEDGSSGCSFGPGGAGRDICVAKFRLRLCGNLTTEESPLLDACTPSLEDTSPMCFGVGYVVPDACWPVINSNN